MNKNLSKEKSAKLNQTIKFWGLDRGLAQFDTLTNTNLVKKIEDIFQNTPLSDNIKVNEENESL